MKLFIRFQRLTLLWALFITIICSIKLGKIGESKIFFAGFDKLVHCGLFFVLLVLSANGILRQNKTSQLSYPQGFIITILAVLFGGFIELIQLYIFTWRDGEWDDLFADTVGILIASFSILVVQKAINYAKR